MGINIKSKQKKGVTLYRLQSTISDELLTKEEWVDIDTAKKALITRKVWKFVDEVEEIEMMFPHGYRVNDGFISRKDGPDFFDYLKEQYSLDDGGKQQFQNFLAVLEKHNIAMYNQDTITRIAADIRNKLSPLVNLAQMVADNVNTDFFKDEEFLEILKSCSEVGVDSSKLIINNLQELEKMAK